MILCNVRHELEMLCLWRDLVRNEMEFFRVDRFQTIILAAHGWRYVDCRSCGIKNGASQSLTTTPLPTNTTTHLSGS